MRHFNRFLLRYLHRNFLFLLVFSLLPLAAIQVIAPTKAEAASTCVATNTYSSNIKVEPVHGKVFYIDTGQGQNVDATYVGYKVTANAAKENLWVRIDSFTGGVVSLANPLDQDYPLGTLNGTSGTPVSKLSYFLLKAPRSSTVAQSHVVHVFKGRPDLSGSTDLYQCSFSFSKVAETIKAKANKVTSITASTTTLVLGSTLTVTTRGATGTIGNGSALDGAMLWLSPASKSSWPSQALRLESETSTFYSSKNYRTGATTYADQLYIKNASGTPSSGSQFWYQAQYVFRIIGSSVSTATVAPIAQIASGTQIKHTDVTSLPAASLNTNTVSVSASITKDASTTTTRGADNKTVITYTLTLRNTGSSSVNFDSVVDTPSQLLTYKALTAQSGATVSSLATYPEPHTDINGNVIFDTPITVAANSTMLLRYSMIEKTACTTGDSFSFSNSTIAKIGNYTVSSGTNTISGILATGTISVFAFMSVGLFCSTLWPCIFTLAIAGLGSKMSKASNYLIMMIMGGGVVSVLQGRLASADLLGILNSYWVGVACFAYLAYYAVSMTAHFKKAGIEVGQASGGH